MAIVMQRYDVMCIGRWITIASRATLEANNGCRQRECLRRIAPTDAMVIEISENKKH